MPALCGATVSVYHVRVVEYAGMTYDGACGVEKHGVHWCCQIFRVMIGVIFLSWSGRLGDKGREEGMSIYAFRPSGLIARTDYIMMIESDQLLQHSLDGSGAPLLVAVPVVVFITAIVRGTTSPS